jgi:ribonuclease J
VLPFHGEYRHQVIYRKLALSMGGLFQADQVMLPEDGLIMEFSEGSGRVVEKTPVGYIYVDGTTVGDVDTVVVRDRQMLSRDGILMVVVSVDRASGQLIAGPDIVSRGFVYMRQNNELIESTKETVREMFKTVNGSWTESDTAFVNRKIKDTVGDFLYRETKRRPMVLPLVMEV